MILDTQKLNVNIDNHKHDNNGFIYKESPITYTLEYGLMAKINIFLIWRSKLYQTWPTAATWLINQVSSVFDTAALITSVLQVTS